MKIAFMFPGQGAQVSGMGKDFYDKYEEVKEFYRKVKDWTNMNVEKLCFETPIEVLSQTQNAQIAISVTSLAIAKVLRNCGIKPYLSLGLSLGEYTALMDSGYISLEQGIPLLQKRGKIMAEEVPEEEYEMVAVIGIESTVIEKVCQEISEGKHERVWTSNYNYSGQTVLSGNKEAVEKAIQALKEKQARKIIPLKTSGPFHTPKLQKASQIFAKELSKIDIYPNDEKILKNLDGTFYQEQDPIKEILKKHMIKPVRFDKQIQKMKQEGIDTFIEIGPGKTLTGFVKKEVKEGKFYNVATVEQLEELISNWKEN